MEVNDILNHVAHITAAPVWVCENGNESGLRFIRCYPVEGQKTEHPSQCILDLLTQRHSCGCPILASVGNVLYYALIPGNQERYLLGPVHLSAFLALRHAFPAEAGNLLNAGIAICDIPVFLYSALLVRNLFTDSPVTAEEVLASNCLDSKDIDIQRYYSKLVFSNREGGQQHNAYSQEFRLMSSIERGDVQMVKKCFQERVSGAFGTLAPTMERNARNLGISVTVLASRAAIRGGVNYEQAQFCHDGSNRAFSTCIPEGWLFPSTGGKMQELHAHAASWKNHSERGSPDAGDKPQLSVHPVQAV